MTEENNLQESEEASPEEEDLDSEQDSSSSLENAADSQDQVTELPQSIVAKAGDSPPDELEPLRSVCTLVEQKYQAVLEVIKTIRGANAILQKFLTREGDLTPKDVEAAKKQFHEAKRSYIELGNHINDGIKQVHVMAKTYPEDLLVQNLYITYLAKLLGSLETRNPLEPYVKQLADNAFVFDREDILLTEEEKRRDLTVEKKKHEVLEFTALQVARLEARYQKRQLQNRLRAGERSISVLRQLVRLSKQDPTDIHTFIWIAQLMSKEINKQRDQNKRLELRDDILSYCQRAFSQIDDFLHLQVIQNLSDRDKRRSEYVKSITAIRKPLVEN